MLVTAQLSDKVPPFLEGKGVGWLTAEYAMLPGSTPTRKSRGNDGRSTEIQRLIGRSLRAVIDTKALGPWTVHVDADVIEADGGTRTAAITGAWVALHQAIYPLVKAKGLKSLPIREHVAAISCGISNGASVLDLDYAEDSACEVDANFVMTGSGGLVEVQATAEGAIFTDEQLADLNVEFEKLPASKVIQWAADSFGPHLALAASMTDAVLIDLAVKVAPAIEVVFIDTGYHFPETLETVEADVAERAQLLLVRLGPVTADCAHHAHGRQLAGGCREVRAASAEDIGGLARGCVE